MFETCHKKHRNFKVRESLKGKIVHVDWRDTEAKELHEAIGEDTADLVLNIIINGCSVHHLQMCMTSPRNI